MRLELYLAPGASSMAPHIALNEAGADFETRVISFAQRQNRSPEFLAVNPEGKVPALAIDGRPLTEVLAILWWIGKTWPEAGLLPEGEEGKAQALSWMSFIASTLHAAGRGGVEAGQRAYAQAEQRLDGREWALGGYSVADIHLFRLFWRFHPIVELSREDYPGLWAHHDRMVARPAVIRTIEAEKAIGYELPHWKDR